MSPSVRAPLSIRRRLLFASVAALGVLTLVLVAAEVVARAAGYQPFRLVPLDILIEPGGRYQQRDPVLGFRHLPGRYRITFPNGKVWNLHHREDTLRATRPVESDDGAAYRPQLWLFGCSFVHGWGLEDDETLPWQLQERLTEFDVVNFGVGGYGTWQSFLQYQDALRTRRPPAIAVLGYAGFHDERNTRSRRWRRATYHYDQDGDAAYPYLRLDADGRLDRHFDEARYTEFALLRRSALMNLADSAYSAVEDRLLESHRVSEMIIDQFAEESRNRSIVFAVVGISRGPRTRAMLDYATRAGLPASDIAADLSKPGYAILYDGHPSALANRVQAARLASFLHVVDWKRAATP
ncbi:MAG: hypothetical protein O7G30_08380 [Proteobacteria bacterium]|nr:hypothetical protein [Pseudomonadota bacterium]